MGIQVGAAGLGNTGGTLMVKRNNLVNGLIAGAAVGTVVGLLFAPKPGKDSRQIMASRAREIRHKAGGYLRKVRSWRNNRYHPGLVGPYEWRTAQDPA